MNDKEFRKYEIYPAGFIAVDSKGRPLVPRLVRQTPKAAMKALVKSSVAKELPTATWGQYEALGWKVVACYFQFKSFEEVEQDFNEKIAEAYAQDHYDKNDKR